MTQAISAREQAILRWLPRISGLMTVCGELYGFTSKEELRTYYMSLNARKAASVRPQKLNIGSWLVVTGVEVAPVSNEPCVVTFLVDAKHTWCAGFFPPDEEYHGFLHWSPSLRYIEESENVNRT